ncbi:MULTISPECIES: flagellar hook assembly protein FlgD [unclassified Arthrobacter]|uniref:flagellar hook assembly protein FlgD n=1 Tax=unclassified Arthrobacter TaxID=235627 RepID=UPI00149143B0|nr:flagellar hook capping FlgD N-terminal domain-containing protein [Arthrobacter sp. AET 35A]MBE0010810.1 flagellar hook capping protein [Arthrobacter sp. AET 35A]NOJ60486.1 flagellar hook capping protein [Arthrobacter sp. 260]NOJ64623.1 flagellar hook capping protein [Arthrobacter sp. 147(2020)]
MPIEAVEAALPSFQGDQVQRAPKQAMDSEVFMSLLVSQLQNQDPSSPMDTNQMISQTTQLAMMEKITEMTGTIEENFFLEMRTSAATLLGKEVSYTDDAGSTATGMASAVSFAGPVPTVTIGTASIPLDQISGVVTPPTATF